MVGLARLCGGIFTFGLVSMLSVAAAGQYGAPPPRPEVPQGKAPSTAPAQATPASATRADVLRAAACVAGRNASDVDALLVTSPFTADEREKAVRLLRTAERCLRLRSPIATSAMVFRGAVAETLYETRFPQAPAARSPAAAAAPFFRPADVAGNENAALLTTHFELGQCVAPAQPDLVRALLATEPGTDAERTALTALHPALGSCVPAGTQLRVDPGGIRATLAEALYRWSVVQRDGPTSAWAAPPAPATPTG